MAKNVRKLGLVCLAIYLILIGLVGLIPLSFSGLWVIRDVLALVAGVLLLIGR
ncbi:MAG TPA: hypothetical protein VKA53_01480 [Thermoanaerobaculia bacterium]|nr:hypothetical protein [Thermoanaerobaculia bacterium]